MPRSKKRKHHHEFHAPANAEKSQKNKSAVPAGIVFFTLVGIGIAFFAAGSDPLWLGVGALAGAAGGYFFGKQVDKSFSKK
ncbi:MAG TPA: hypothetical protein PLZ45_14585 [Ferruginibacter sp.]|nr:hypothetical protein [Chitinophagaceae bacterium]HRI25902.1 hypothetical protein [Ferruginibacter sp.]